MHMCMFVIFFVDETMDPKQSQQSTEDDHQPFRAESRQGILLENPPLLELQLTGESTIQEGSSGYPTLPSSGYLPHRFLPEPRVEHAENIDPLGVVAKSEEVNAAEAMLTLSQTPVVDPKGLVAFVAVNHPAHQSRTASLEGDESLSLPSRPSETVSQDIRHISVAELSLPGTSTSASHSSIPHQENPDDPAVEEGAFEDSFDDSHLEKHRLRSQIRTEKPNVLNVGNLEELISHFDAPTINKFHERCPKCNMRPSTYERLPFWCKVNWELEINGLKIPRVDYGQPVFLVNTYRADRYFGNSGKTTNRDFFDQGPSTSFD
ncbi:uncharacterized protein [Euwallacea similis]|uniref:uncharacterized protein n=1 Tax=Euwallacea similis TaxID=1736056 RepID=UPI00344C619F